MSIKPFERALRRWRNAVFPSQNHRRRCLSRPDLLANSVVARHHGRSIRWCFQYAYAREFAVRFILPWALPQAEPLPADAPADLAVGVHLYDETIIGSFADLPGQKFLLSGELETRHPRLDRALSFVQGPQPADDPQYIRYAPILCFWVPPLTPIKSRLCSVVDSGRYPWRVELINKLAAQIGSVDIFGGLSNRNLGGYHGQSAAAGGNDKCLGIQDYCFYLSLERAIADDYLTEKFADAVLCDAVPIYHGAPNVRHYAHSDSYITTDEVGRIDWANWRREYDRRLPALRAQKEFLRTRLNVFSYFATLADNPSLLNQPRPITLAQ
ncbi:MAG: hypothetical protein HKL96_08200 [Phycisphaerales bacterium]|nr:hypothetical protein [Phycisphaerales bacterium]